jgi:hypothetical protein
MQNQDYWKNNPPYGEDEKGKDPVPVFDTAALMRLLMDD